MERRSLGNGRWFDSASAKMYKESSYHDGNNWISCATGEQFRHEALFKTKNGIWVINRYASYNGEPETYSIINIEEAAAWFAKQPELEVPEELQFEFNKLEV